MSDLWFLIYKLLCYSCNGNCSQSMTLLLRRARGKEILRRRRSLRSSQLLVVALTYTSVSFHVRRTRMRKKHSASLVPKSRRLWKRPRQLLQNVKGLVSEMSISQASWYQSSTFAKYDFVRLLWPPSLQWCSCLIGTPSLDS